MRIEHEGREMKKDSLIIGLALFAMFFGAGNLIFPPYLGMTSGSEWLVGFACFVFIDVVLSCLGIFAINAAGGSIKAVQGALGTFAGIALNSLAIICTGFLIGTPRTAATTYEMSVVPLIGDWGAVGLAVFSVVFFGAVFLLSYKESRIVSVIGKILTPVLVVGIVIVVIAGIVNPIGPIGAPTSEHVAQDGILSGYQAMDIISIVGFSIVVQDAIRNHGYSEKRDQHRMMAYSSCVAGLMLALLYGGLTYLGATAGSSLGEGLNQASLIVAITYELMGNVGVVVLAVVVGFACFTTAVGLVGATAAYFERVTSGRISYRAGVIVTTLASLLICNLGLTNIVGLAGPILSVICPPFMVTVVLLLFRRHLPNNWVYRGAALVAALVSLAVAVHDYTGLFLFVESLPFFDYGFGWLLPAAAGGLIGGVAKSLLSRRLPASSGEDRA